MTRRKPPAKRGSGVRAKKPTEDVGGYVQCQSCGTIMVGSDITHCSNCGSGAMLTRQDWGDVDSGGKPFPHTGGSR